MLENNKFSIDNFIEKNQDKELILSIIEVEKELDWLIKVGHLTKGKNPRFDKYEVGNYRNQIDNLSLFLGSGIVASKSGMSVFIPIVKKLVEKNQLKPSGLDAIS